MDTQLSSLELPPAACLPKNRPIDTRQEKRHRHRYQVDTGICSARPMFTRSRASLGPTRRIGLRLRGGATKFYGQTAGGRTRTTRARDRRGAWGPWPTVCHQKRAGLQGEKFAGLINRVNAGFRHIFEDRRRGTVGCRGRAMAIPISGFGSPPSPWIDRAAAIRSRRRWAGWWIFAGPRELRDRLWGPRDKRREAGAVLFRKAMGIPGGLGNLPCCLPTPMDAHIERPGPAEIR